MTTEIKAATTPAEITKENREVSLAKLTELGIPVSYLGGVISRDGMDYVVVATGEAISLKEDTSPDLIEPTDEEKAAIESIDVETRLNNIAKAAIAFKLNYNSTMATMHLAMLEFMPQEMSYDIDKDSETIQKYITAQEGGEHALTLMKLDVMLSSSLKPE